MWKTWSSSWRWQPKLPLVIIGKLPQNTEFLILRMEIALFKLEKPAEFSNNKKYVIHPNVIIILNNLEPNCCLCKSLSTETSDCILDLFVNLIYDTLIEDKKPKKKQPHQIQSSGRNNQSPDTNPTETRSAKLIASSAWWSRDVHTDLITN